MEQNEKLTTFDKLYVASLLFYCFLLFAPTVYAIVPLSAAAAGAARLAIAGALTVYAVQQSAQHGGVRINRGLLLLSFTFVLTALVPTAYHGTAYLLTNEFTGFYLVYMFFLFYKRKHLHPLITAATAFTLVMLAMSIAGFLYALMGGQPVLSGLTAEGRAYYWYLTTGAVDNGIFGNVIRPQGIYDEPGGFSFVICTLCFLRMLAKRSDKTTFALMLLGNITLSMIHIALFTVYICHLVMRYKTKKTFAVYAALALTLMAAAYAPIREQADSLLLARFAVNKSTGRLEGNNRGYLLDNALELAKKNSSALIWGLPRDADGLTVMDKTWGYGENPLAPALKLGIFAAWLYYFYLAFFMMCGVIDRRNLLVYTSIVLMLLQRPEFYKGGTAACVLTLFFTGWETIKARVKKRRLMYDGKPGDDTEKCPHQHAGLGNDTEKYPHQRLVGAAIGRPPLPGGTTCR